MAETVSVTQLNSTLSTLSTGRTMKLKWRMVTHIPLGYNLVYFMGSVFTQLRSKEFSSRVRSSLDSGAITTSTGLLLQDVVSFMLGQVVCLLAQFSSAAPISHSRELLAKSITTCLRLNLTITQLLLT